MKTNTYTILVLSLICAIAASSVFYWLMVQVRTNTLDAYNMQQQASTASADVNHMHVLTNIVEKYQDEQESFKKLFVSSDEIVSFLQELEQLGRSAGVVTEVGSIHDKGNSVLISVSTDGSFAQVRSFLELMENIQYAAFIESVYFTKHKQDGVWGCQIKLSVLKYES